MQRWYIIKNTGPWMLDELLAFSRQTNFTILFLRAQKDFHQDKISEIAKNGVKIKYLSDYRSFTIHKVLFAIQFFFRNIKRFTNTHSFIYGINALYFFLLFDLRLFNHSKISIHSQFATQASIFGVLIKSYFKNTNKISFYFTYHAYDIYVKNLWFNLLVDQSNAAFSISHYNIRYIGNNYNTAGEKLLYSPLGVFLPKDVEYNTPSDTIHIGFLSYFVEMKGVRYLLPAIKELKEIGLKFRFHFAGIGPLEIEMQEYIKLNNLDNVIIFHGIVKNEAKDSFYRSLHLFILPSISIGMETDGLPVVLMEAISYGIPIISTNVSGIPEICIDGYNGFLIKERDTPEIVNSVLRFSQSKTIWPILSQNAFETSQRFNIEKNAENKLKLLAWL